MSSDDWKFLKAFLKDFGKEGKADVPPQVLSVVANEIERAILSPRRGDLDAARTALHEAIREAIAVSPDRVRRAVTGQPDADPELKAAFLLGQLEFAQMSAARAYSRRADDPTDDLAELWDTDAVKDAAARATDAGHSITRSPAGEIVFSLESGYYLIIVENHRSARTYPSFREQPYAVLWAAGSAALSDVEEHVELQGEFDTAEEAFAFACGRIDLEWNRSSPGAVA